METAYSIIIFILCLNVGIYFISEQLNLTQLKNKQILNTTELENYGNVLSAIGSNSTSIFDPILIFGNFILGLQILISIFTFGGDVLSLGPIIRMFQVFGFPETFVLPAKVVIGFFLAAAFTFMITGRGSKTST